MTQAQVYYSDYLELDKILNAQQLESNKHPVAAHDEMLFIIIHQTYELWFKQILHEVDFSIETMKKPSLNDNSPELQMVVHWLTRITIILKVLVQQIDIMESMTPMDFLDFRDILRPASGFQSWQFKLIEAKLGLKFEQRHGQQYYISQLRQDNIDTIKNAELEKTLLELVVAWLERMPFFTETANWENYKTASSSREADIFWADYRYIYKEGLSEAERINLQYFDQIFYEDQQNAERSFSPTACRAALFIMLYRGYPMLQIPFQLLKSLLEIDEQLGIWRYRHVNMVQRMIGTRIGTGGSSGKDYLKEALAKHYIFAELAQLTSFLVERRRLPVLSPEMERRLGFAV